MHDTMSQTAVANTNTRKPVRAATPPVSSRYVVCVAVLLAFFVTLQTLTHTFELYFRKEAVPLKKSLKSFDRTALRPQYDLHPALPQPIDHDTLQTLGTEEYVDLRIVDLSKPRNDVTSVAHVFITYYTGKPDMVPHVPEECYLAGGFDRVGPARDAEVAVANVGAPDDEVPLRIIEFRNRSGLMTPTATTSDNNIFSVIYFFHSNDAYYTTRNQVRLALSSPWDRYAYYAKFEIRFSDYAMSTLANTDQALAALPDLLAKLMPTILEEHFADWEQLADEGDEGDDAPPASPQKGES